jgi:hypothetical protein
MTLPSGGPISFAQIATELGRTGTSVSLNQSDVAALAGKTTSSSIIVPNDFWGKSAVDATPDAVNWWDISSSGSLANYNANTNGINISGINTTITLRIELTAKSTPGASQSYITPYRAALAQTGIDIDASAVGTWVEFTVTNGQNVYFNWNVTGVPVETTSTGTIAVKNMTDGGVTLDTFNLSYYRFL